jgi:serine protease inhibitor ecotin
MVFLNFSGSDNASKPALGMMGARGERKTSICQIFHGSGKQQQQTKKMTKIEGGIAVYAPKREYIRYQIYPAGNEQDHYNVTIGHKLPSNITDIPS